jgi:hypothetical protein
MSETFLEYKDLFLTPFFLVLIFSLAFVFKAKFVKNKNLKKYFIPALTLKLVGAISLGLIYNFYYGGGDTYNYFHDINVIYQMFLSRPLEGISLLFIDIDANSLQLNRFNTDNFTYYMIFIRDHSSFMIVRIGGFFSFFTFGTYTLIALCFAIISFVGVWTLFLCLTKIYPHLIKEIAIAVFFLPSVFFWGSGLMKDSITLASVCLAFYAFYNIFIEKRRKALNTILLIFALYLIIIIKIYIALCLIPACILYLFILFNNRIKSKSFRIFLRPFLISIGLVTGYFAISQLAKEDEKYNMQNIASTAKTTSEYLERVSRISGGSFYSLGEFEPTPVGMLKKLPQAIWVSLFRPYIWESKSPTMLLSAFESLFFLYLTISILIKLGFRNCYIIIKNNPFVQFALLFSFAFGFAVGITSNNFGTLVRYKIPMMPFYLSAIFVIKSYYKRPRRPVSKAI